MFRHSTEKQQTPIDILMLQHAADFEDVFPSDCSRMNEESSR